MTELQELEGAVTLQSKRPSMVVARQMRWDSRFLIADQIVFEPGGTLVFSQNAQALGGPLYLVATSMVMRDAKNPGVITWQRPIAVGPPLGSDVPAAHGNDGANGRDGLPGGRGARGLDGSAGADAPTLVVLVENIEGGTPHFDFAGQQGGKGGNGQAGGDGGKGGDGRRASQSAFKCKRDSTKGGSGGAAGAGGDGGNGGSGGKGGTVSVLGTEQGVELTFKAMSIDTSGGIGGPGGEPGQPGSPGAPGKAGRGQGPFCVKQGAPGTSGRAAEPSLPGSEGSVGAAGDIRIVPLQAETWSKLARPGTRFSWWPFRRQAAQ